MIKSSNDLTSERLLQLVTDFAAFSRACYPRRALRRYQLAAAAPLLDAILAGRGGQFTILFPRQAGKDELLAQLCAFLLARYRLRGGSLVVAAPVYNQCLIARRRLRGLLLPALHRHVGAMGGYGIQVGAASVAYLSAAPEANIRGETAGLALITNEAQDVRPDIYDSRLAPMTASTNAVTVFAGTPWAAGSLLDRETAISAQRGTLQRTDWHQVAAELPAYGDHVRSRIAQLGANHPFIRTEYELKTLDSDGGLFPLARQAQMHGSHDRQHEASDGVAYAILVDVGGGAEDTPQAGEGREARHDSTVATVVAVDLATVADDLIRRPSYRVVERRAWTGVRHSVLLPQLLDLVREVWRARWLVIDSTGLGQGLAALLADALKGRCIVYPFVFTAQSKSALGWGFLGCIDSGRFKDYAPDGRPDTSEYWAQVAATVYTVAPGPGKLMAWSVPASRGHDDLVVSAALVAHIDQQDWRPRVLTVRKREDFV